MAIARGGQNAPPARMRGANPAIVVREVEITWRLARRTTRTAAPTSPRAAASFSSSAARTTIESLMAIPMRPIAPTMVMKPKGAPKVATARSARPTERKPTAPITAASAEGVEGQHERRGHQHEEERRRAARLPTASSRFALSPPTSSSNPGGSSRFLGEPRLELGEDLAGEDAGLEESLGRGDPLSVAVGDGGGLGHQRELAERGQRGPRAAGGADLEGLDPLDVSPGLAGHADPDGQFLGRLQERAARQPGQARLERGRDGRVVEPGEAGGLLVEEELELRSAAVQGRAHVGHARDAGHDEADLLPVLAQAREIGSVEVHLDRRVEGRPLFDLLREDDRAGQRLVEGVLDLADDPDRILRPIELDHGLGEVGRVALRLDQVVVVLRPARPEEQVHALDARVGLGDIEFGAPPRSWSRGRRSRCARALN